MSNSVSVDYAIDPKDTPECEQYWRDVAMKRLAYGFKEKFGDILTVTWWAPHG